MSATDNKITQTAKGEAIRVRLDSEEQQMLTELGTMTNGIKGPELMRRAAKFALPKFLSGEVDILTLETRGN